MIKRKIQLSVICIILILGGLSAWYLFQQSNKLIDADPGRDQETVGLETEQHEPSPQKKQPELKVITEQETAETEETNDLQPDTNAWSAESEENQKISFAAWIRDYVITNYFIQDLTEYMLAHYSPPHTKKNPREKGQVRLNFKSLNARYGLELTGFKYRGDDPQEARQEILSQIMDKEVLENIYDLYLPEFIEQFLQAAQEKKWVFVTAEGEQQKRGLSKDQLAELLENKSAYMSDLAHVFNSLAHDETTTKLVKDYLQHEQDAVHANYVLNQEQNRVRLLRKQAQKLEEKDQELQIDIAQAEQDMDAAAQDYRRAIQQRERAREALITEIRAQDRPQDLEGHDILFVAEWVQRRFVQGQNQGAVAMVAQILQDLAQQFSQKAAELRS